MLIHNAEVTGSLLVNGIPYNTGSFSGSFLGTISTASYVEYNNVANKPALLSGSAQVAAFGFATTGSNQFNGNQTVTGSLVVLGSNSIPQFRIIRSESLNQGMTITAGSGDTIFNSIEGGNVIYGQYIFNATKGTDTQERMRITSDGNVLIGTTTNNGQKLQVGGGSFRLNGSNANSRFILYENYSGGSVGIQMFNTSGVNVIDFNSFVGSGTFSGTLTASNFISSSDRRLKSEIKEIKDAVLKLSKFKAYEYIKDNKQDAGFIAQEVQKVLPYSVFEMDSGYLSMNDRPILALIHQAIIEINERLTKLENK
jgi:hypothetical protein